MFIKSLIQFSVDGQGCVPSLLLDLRPNYGGGNEDNGDLLQKDQFSLQSQRKAMPKNVQTTTQLYSSHTLAKQCSKFSKPGFNSMWTLKFQMFKLDLETAEEPETKLPTSAGSSKKQDVPEKHPLLLYWLCQSFWLCGSQQTVENS